MNLSGVSGLGTGSDRRSRHQTSAGSKVVQHFFPGTSASAVAPY